MQGSAGMGLAALLAVATSACVTGERLWRVTPFEGTGTSERVNLWPLAYHDRDETALLWPLFDVDDEGFALRPLIARDGTAWSALFPLAAWDTDAGTGWAVPFYWFEEHAGLFPLAHFGRLNYAGPVWWSEGASGLFPLAMFGDLSYVGPVWWSAGEQGGRGGFFPLALLGPAGYVGPAWWTGAQDSWGLFPLFGRNLFGSDIDHAGPFWWRADPVDGFEGGLFPLVSWGAGGSRFSLLPLYSHDLRPDARTRNALLGIAHRTRSEQKSESWLLPLYYRREEPGKADTALVPFFWKRTRGDEADVFTLLGNRSVDPQSSSLNLYPFWWSNEGPDSSWKMLVPFFWFERAGDERTLLTPLGGRGWSTSGAEAFVNVLGPLYHHSRSVRRDEERTAFLWPLFERHREGAEQTTNLAGLYARRESPAGSDTTWAFGLGHASRTQGGRSHRLWPLYSWSSDAPVPGPFYGLTLFRRRDRLESSEQSLFPLFSSARSPSGSEWNALLGLVHHHTTGTEEHRSARTWAWPLASFTDGEPAGFADWTTLFGAARWPGGRHVQLGAGLLHSAGASTTPELERTHSRTLLFLTHAEERFVGAHVPVPVPEARANRVRHATRGFLFDAFLSERSTYRTWREGLLGAEEAATLRAYSRERGEEGLPERARVREILAAHGAAPGADDPGALRAAIRAFAAENTDEHDSRRVRIPFLYGYERGADELAWSGPLGLVSYTRDPERASLRLLYYGYRSETERGRTQRDIFPFITWDSGPDETRVSFLWRLFRYERRGEQRGGHVLFVPWGDA